MNIAGWTGFEKGLAAVAIVVVLAVVIAHRIESAAMPSRYVLDMGSKIAQIPVYKTAPDVGDALDWMDQALRNAPDQSDAELSQRFQEHNIALGAVFVQREARVALLQQAPMSPGRPGLQAVQVRVLDGEHIDYAGWVNGCWLNPSIGCGSNR